jgi:L-rhamnose mutarotase
VSDRDFEKKVSEEIKRVLDACGIDRYLIFLGSEKKIALLHKADNENDLVRLILLGIVDNLKNKPEEQEFLRTVLLSAVTGDAYGTGWWDRLKKVVQELDQQGKKWFGRA